jgi:hypothetical protein
MESIRMEFLKEIGVEVSRSCIFNPSGRKSNTDVAHFAHYVGKKKFSPGCVMDWAVPRFDVPGCIIVAIRDTPNQPQKHKLRFHSEKYSKKHDYKWIRYHVSNSDEVKIAGECIRYAVEWINDNYT